MDTARHVRIFEPAATDDFVTKRDLAIKDLRGQFVKQNTVGELFALGADVVRGAFLEADMPQPLVDKIAAALKKQSASFVADDCTLEMRICGALAAGQVVTTGGKSDEWAVGDVVAMAIWLATDFIPPLPDPNLEALRVDLHAAGRQRVLRTAIESRDRKAVPDVGVFGGDTVSPESFAKALAAVPALRYNAALDREELDLLWWLYAGHSIILDRPLAGLSQATRAVITGIELGSLMRRLPSQSHRNLVLRDIAPDQSMSLNELLEAIDGDRATIADTLDGETLLGHAPDVFPLLTGIVRGTASGTAAQQPRSMGDWAARAILERSATRIQYPANRLK